LWSLIFFFFPYPWLVFLYLTPLFSLLGNCVHPKIFICPPPQAPSPTNFLVLGIVCRLFFFIICFGVPTRSPQGGPHKTLFFLQLAPHFGSDPLDSVFLLGQSFFSFFSKSPNVLALEVLYRVLSFSEKPLCTKNLFIFFFRTFFRQFFYLRPFPFFPPPCREIIFSPLFFLPPRFEKNPWWGPSPKRSWRPIFLSFPSLLPFLVFGVHFLGLNFLCLFFFFLRLPGSVWAKLSIWLFTHQLSLC